MTTELSKLLQLPETKSDIKVYVSKLKHDILEGENDPLKVLKLIKCYEVVFDELKHDPDIEQAIQKEASLYSENTIDLHGCKFTKMERPTFDFSVCGDSELTSLYSQISILKEKIKERETFLKVVPDNFVNMETGEILNRPIKTSKSVISVTLR